VEIVTQKSFNKNSYSDKYLWRYIDLFKLFDLLNNETLYFNRFDYFEDGLEGITGNGISLKAFSSGDPLTKKNINPAFSINEQNKIIKHDKAIRNEYKTEKEFSQKTQYANCWFLGEKESLAMWKLYSLKSGVAIKFKALDIIDMVIESAKTFPNSKNKKMYFGPVNYKNIWPFDHTEIFEGQFSGLKKDKSYSHENEFRFVIIIPISRKVLYHSFKIPIPKVLQLNFSIIASPFMDKWEFENLKAVLEKYKINHLLSLSKMVLNK